MASASSTPATGKAAKKVLTCSKCGTENHHSNNTCTQCNSHLYVSCHKCSARNPREKSRCASCGARLHRSSWSRLRKKIFQESKGFKPMHAGLLIVAVLFAYRMIVWISNWKFDVNR